MIEADLDQYEADEGDSYMVSLYEDLGGDGSSPVYLSSGEWLFPDGSVQDL